MGSTSCRRCVTRIFGASAAPSTSSARAAGLGGAAGRHVEPVTAQTRAGELRIVPEPWGTRGYDDLRIRAGRENLGRGLRPAVASVVDCVRMLDASGRDADDDRLLRLRRLMELERQLVPSRRLGIER